MAVKNDFVTNLTLSQFIYDFKEGKSSGLVFASTSPRRHGNRIRVFISGSLGSLTSNPLFSAHVLQEQSADSPKNTAYWVAAKKNISSWLCL